MNDTRQRNFVAPDLTVEPPRQDLVRRGDVVDQVGRLIDVYQEQQRAALATVQADATRGGYLSDAGQVAERRKLTRLYLLTYGGVSGLTMGGLAMLAWLAGADGVLSLAGWMFATGALTLGLVWARHGDEFRHSPEGIARHVIDAHWALSEYEAETRRKAIAWEHHAEQRRQHAAELAAADARAQAALRIEEIETRRKWVEAQNAHNHAWADAPERAPVALAGRGGAWDGAQAETHVEDATNALGGSTAVSAGASWQDALVAWLGGLYADGATVGSGIIKDRVPWAARSDWAVADKAQAKRVCCELKPALIVPSDGGRWRLRVEMFEDADIALRLLAGRLE